MERVRRLLAVFPAYAGMILTKSQGTFDTSSVPRIRGDDPRDMYRELAVFGCSPHTRG